MNCGIWIDGYNRCPPAASQSRCPAQAKTIADKNPNATAMLVLLSVVAVNLSMSLKPLGVMFCNAESLPLALLTIVCTAAALIDVDAWTAAEALALGTPVMVNLDAALAFVARNLPSAAKRRFAVHDVTVLHFVLAARPNCFFTSVQIPVLNAVDPAIF